VTLPSILSLQFHTSRAVPRQIWKGRVPSCKSPAHNTVPPFCSVGPPPLPPGAHVPHSTGQPRYPRDTRKGGRGCVAFELLLKPTTSGARQARKELFRGTTRRCVAWPFPCPGDQSGPSIAAMDREEASHSGPEQSKADWGQKPKEIGEAQHISGERETRYGVVHVQKIADMPSE